MGNNTYRYLFVLFFTSSIFVLTTSCQKRKEKKIILIHSFEQGRGNYSIFNKVLEQSLQEKGISPKFQTFYLDCENYLDSQEKIRMYNYIDSIKETKPDIILVNDDQACYSLLACNHPFLKKIPIVFAGVNYPNWDIINKYPNVTGIHDKQDFIKNIEFIHRLFGKLVIRIACDRTVLGNKALGDFLSQIKGHQEIEFIRNSFTPETFPFYLSERDGQFLEKLLSLSKNGVKSLHMIHPNSIGAINLSPYRILPGSTLLYNMSGLIENVTSLDIKYDHTSESIYQLVNYPSFSAHNEPVQYAPQKERNRYIGGYFTPIEIQAKEQAQMASLILSGVSPSQIPIKESKKEYVLVWHVMKSWGLPVNQVPNYVRMVNVPFYEMYKKPLIALICIVFILISIVTTNLWRLYAREQKYKKIAQDDLVKQNKDLEIALEKAKESDKMKSAFLANMSHEIRTPLNAIVGFSNLLNADIEIEQEEKDKFTELINSNSELLLSLINDILDLSRIESGRMSFVLDKHSLNELITSIYQTYQVLMPANVALRINIPEEDIPIVTDKNRLTQVITNFMNNSIKFTKEGYIMIGYEYQKEQEQIHIFVEDTGIGIPKEKQEAIFDRFTKLDEFAKGTGLGLSICKVIAEHFGGYISVRSEVGKGSHFFIVLPFKPE